ncbi:nitrate/nitrite two-component system sensor histidine kinase NarQ [Pasteurella multocida]|uniref:nitrate/nitrite two-component system sensor histidine kinase NarQ n=1 Tax=Pasteurella multocida TaxID=747 RepID=UPI0028DE536F|nr:nitrate/nitrite two-component system sensor histidine kinase NarQ [Pasteurella multocida]HDR1153525.1 nitrate/nitrite two-component system sensor histidine kinase NarQ [Pasteurella multocida]HDR1164427.1 nitrate/nitrite two-component system sensor histidine kinase NarQ [Pasteurella multocida]HDR1508780.1 nitrate/nitrite two-component system sensor histidine kinase NarQ [Pasteurella multocida]HEA3316516.1 nitrate/nitrite two-component system sensor histidine kinase NarQ [Pasteurella multocida
MKIKHSVSTKIANYLFIIMIFAGVITSLSLMIMASNKSDAESINVSGSLRMQSYRLLHELEHHPELVETGLRQYRISLHSPALLEIDQWFVPDEVKQSYHQLIKRWERMERYAKQREINAYKNEIADYVAQVDQFVFTLQRFAEKKWIIAVLIMSLSMLSIIAMVAYVVWYARKEVVMPLKQLTQASIQVQMRQFSHVKVDTQKEDELGNLARAFSQMSSELEKLYSSLEESVNEKTQKLRQTNRSLTMLYESSQQLTTTNVDESILQHVLKNIFISEHLRYMALVVEGAEHWNIRFGQKQANQDCQEVTLQIEDEKLAVLYWQAGFPCPDPRTMRNIAQILSRTLYFHKTQRQQQQLLLMEERAIIARELHDSLAQVLAFLQIQLTLLKHNINQKSEEAAQQSINIISSFEQALRDGYVQLRELLATFRLTVQEANLKLALEQVVDSLRNQTDIQMCVQCSLPAQSFNAKQLVHILQIVRESVLNAIKHSKGNRIEVIAHINEDGEYEFIVRDDGIGIPGLEEPEGHYGLNIMHERATQLNAHLRIANRPSGGTEIKLTLHQNRNLT